MILEINTSKYNGILLIIQANNREFKKNIMASKSQSELLLPLVDIFLKENDFELSNIEKICVENKGGSFTSLRVGVIVANTLAYALGVSVIAKDKSFCNINGINLVVPNYDRAPNIT